ncbi:MAG: RsmB/NOP family class I SAM-dependent RNA methyltransferase [Shimia sp.]
MTPAAHHAAAIEVLDEVFAGTAPEAALLGWARGHRFAGSKDRAAIRDITFDVLRKRAMAWHLGGAETGRGAVIGWLRATGREPQDVFGADRYAPDALRDAERAFAPSDAEPAIAHNQQPWVWAQLDVTYGPSAPDIATALAARAPLWLRINTAATTREAVSSALTSDGYCCTPHPTVMAALHVAHPARGLERHPLYLGGAFEFQDAAAQAACAMVSTAPGDRVLDYCAGGGGKALAFAARGARVTAHDADPRRMADLPERARRAGVRIDIAARPEGLFDTVICDVPCSGSGTWARAIGAKWTLNEGELATYQTLQRDIVGKAARHLRPGGRLALMTCSILPGETLAHASWAVRAGWRIEAFRLWTPCALNDGFSCMVIVRA